MSIAVSSSAQPATKPGQPAELRLVAYVNTGSAVSPSSRALMRTIDVIGSLLLILLLSPLMLLLALLVKRSSPGPAIFRHERIGRGGVPFVMLKFRSMSEGTHQRVLQDPELRRTYEANGFKLAAGDPSITPLGRVIRRTSLDELPQLFNVLRGEMSLVGVRPIEDGQLRARSPYDQDLYTVHRPGVTGLWQVEGRSLVGDEARADLDRRYLESWSAGRNLGLIVRTPRAVLLGAGAH